VLHRYKIAREILVGIRDHTVPMETPQSMLEEPSSGSKTTQYLNRKKNKNRSPY